MLVPKKNLTPPKSFIKWWLLSNSAETDKIRRGSGGGARCALELRGWPLPDGSGAGASAHESVPPTAAEGGAGKGGGDSDDDDGVLSDDDGGGPKAAPKPDMGDSIFLTANSDDDDDDDDAVEGKWCHQRQTRG